MKLKWTCSSDIGRLPLHQHQRLLVRTQAELLHRISGVLRQQAVTTLDSRTIGVSCRYVYLLSVCWHVFRFRACSRSRAGFRKCEAMAAQLHSSRPAPRPTKTLKPLPEEKLRLQKGLPRSLPVRRSLAHGQWTTHALKTGHCL